MSIIVRKKLTTLFTEALDQFMKPHAVFAGIHCLNTYSTLILGIHMAVGVCNKHDYAGKPLFCYSAINIDEASGLDID